VGKEKGGSNKKGKGGEKWGKRRASRKVYEFGKKRGIYHEE